jgi:hypothetical protein
MNPSMKTLPWIVLVSLGCSSAQTRRPRADALPAGCSVEVLANTAPTRPVQGLGDVTVRCTGDAIRDDAWCLRALQDQACALGAVVIWGVTTTQNDDARVMRAYAGRYR